MSARARATAGTAARVAAALAPAARAAGRGDPRLRGGEFELGAAGSIVTVEGSSQSTWALRAGRFFASSPGLFQAEVETAWSHLRDDDVLDATAAVGWTSRAGQGPLWPYVAAVGGWRQEWLGSFRETRFPVGGALGVRVMITDGADLRVEWRGMEILDDPSGRPFEQRVSMGVAMLLG